MTRTPEQAAADDVLLDALTARLRVDGQIEPDEVVQEFVIACYVDGIGLRERRQARYGFLVSAGSTPTPIHALQGLVVRLDDWLMDRGDR